MSTTIKASESESDVGAWDPCFMFGHTRSGLTILLKILSNYTPVAGCRDQGMLLRFKDVLPHYGDLTVQSNMMRLIQDILNSYEYTRLLRAPEIDATELYDRLPEMTYAALINEVYKVKASASGKTNWIEKTPYYALRIPDLLELFPNARLIHMSRDGRDVAASVFRSKHGHKNGYAAGRYWNDHILAARSGRDLVGSENFYELRYEDLLGDPVGSFAGLVEFLRMDPSLVDAWEKDADSILKRNNTNKWKTQLSDRDIRLFERVAGDTLELYGYKTVTPPESRTPVNPIEARLLRMHSTYRRIVTTSGDYYQRAALRKLHAARMRLLSPLHKSK